MAVTDNLTRFIRMANIFRPDITDGMPDPNATFGSGQDRNNPLIWHLGSETPTAPQDESITDVIRQIFTPDTTYSDMYKKEFERMPVREKPGFMSKLSGALVGLGGGSPEDIEKIKYGKYNRELADWQTRMKSLEPAMTYERYGNVNERTAATQAAGNVLRERDIRRKEAADTARLELENRKLALAAAKQDNPNLVFKIREDGRIVGLHPQTGQPIDTGVDSNQLSDFEKIKLGLESALTKIGAQGDVTARNQASIEAQRQVNRLALEGTRQANRQALIAERTRIWNLLPLQQKQQITNNYEAMIRDNPSLSEFVEVDPNTGMVTVAEVSEPGWFTSGFDKVTRDEVIRRLNEGVNTPRSTTTTRVRPGDTGPPTGRVAIIGPNGQTGTVSIEDSKKLPAGWRVK